ncbi:hypothetical protein D5085_14995 [Ectothiorhodospiraceae bacterium BW-2]|nr:hypothetical protein D5085_14995 [Ectothiorhodospiraceae bacterium BW-2]
MRLTLPLHLGRGVLLLLLTTSPLYAASLHHELTGLVERNPQTATAMAELESLQSQARVTLGQWYPELDLTLTGGGQDNHNSEGMVETADANLRLSQLLWNFGATNLEIEKMARQLEEKRLNLQRVRQQLLVDGASAWINVVRAYRTLQYAIQSEENIQRQTGLEEVRVAGGMGYSTDLLQSQSQLAGASSRRMQAESGYMQASNRYRELFGYPPEQVEQWSYPPADPLTAPLPESLESLLKLALVQNIELQLAKLSDEIAAKNRDQTRANTLFPELKLILESNHKFNSTGIRHQNKDESIAKLELKYRFNLGLSGFDTLDVAIADERAQRQRTLTQTRAIERGVRDGWLQLQTATNRTEVLQQQSEISAGFLELARRERELGNRSLLDVLSGETALITARSDAESAYADTLLAAIVLLQQLGQLELHHFDFVSSQ